MHSIPIIALAAVFVPCQFNAPVLAESLAGAPFVLRQGSGVFAVTDDTMVVGAPLEISQDKYVVTDGKGNRVVMKDRLVVDKYNDNNTGNLEIARLEAHYNLPFVMNADEIMHNWSKGELSKTPWAGDYWATFQDGLNFPWGNGPSASEKYARANGLDVQDFMNKISLVTGIDKRQTLAQPPLPCNTSYECEGEDDEEVVCAKRPGQAMGFCIPRWEGISHGWAPASLLEEEPACPVTINNVTFQPNDIKGLISHVYANAQISALSTGLRFLGGHYINKKDKFGRFVDMSHRDMSPAVLHLVCANLIGRQDIGFVVDVETTQQVWNQPVRSYEFSHVETMEPDAAALKFFNVSSYSTFNKDATKVQYVNNVFKYITNPENQEDRVLSSGGPVDKYTITEDYEYLLELDEHNTVIGGEWVGWSRTKHPDFLWVPVNKPADDFVTRTDISYAFVKTLVNQSRATKC